VHKSEFVEVVNRLVAAKCSGRAVTVLDGLVYLPNDSVFSLVDEELGVFGFGIASGLSLSPNLVAAVSKMNRQSRMGGCWIAEGARDGTFSVVFGMKFFYGLSHPQAAEAQAQGVYDAAPSLRDWYFSYLEGLSAANFLERETDVTRRSFALVSYLG
jgi:hypothetical protein